MPFDEYLHLMSTTVVVMVVLEEKSGKTIVVMIVLEEKSGKTISRKQ